MITKILSAACITALSALAVSPAHSHARWHPEGLTPPRTNADDIKIGPCGAARTSNPTQLPAGATITVVFESTIYHKGDFRIAFSEANDEGFDEHVLADNIPDYDNQRERSVQITLPDTECDQCTLQLIQVMRDRTPPTNYYSCADIQLTREPSSDTTAPGRVSGFTALPGDGQALLSWTAPDDDDYAGVLILLNEQAFTAMPSDGEIYATGDLIADAEVVFAGSSEQISVGDLPHGDTAYFSAFAFDTSFNYAEAVSTSVDLPEQMPNFAPEVTLLLDQVGHFTGTVDTSGSNGDVIITAQLSDENPGDSHTYHWRSVDAEIDDSDSSEQRFRFDPQGMSSGIYEFQLTVTDNGTPALSSTASVFVELAPQPRGGGGSTNLLWLAVLVLAWRRKHQ